MTTYTITSPDHAEVKRLAKDCAERPPEGREWVRLSMKRNGDEWTAEVTFQ